MIPLDKETKEAIRVLAESDNFCSKFYDLYWEEQKNKIDKEILKSIDVENASLFTKQL